ncbi:hypothetical protein IE81DRAFT_72660 [Ceraceosorus guamensis]|uniref:ADF-H domain-containing protein n=1 Tax=Ceraceosorus guamensis TaxID=1522189 RepID=A0A316W274_9BASI|nr:hypothetical protein IE81DRAFT_72660 [Ceraceosorus guamensis]PWN43624.1 hypothetical protein IE81DRAFT_72660 [Ceraceosorus guamensis]
MSLSVSPELKQAFDEASSSLLDPEDTLLPRAFLVRLDGKQLVISETRSPSDAAKSEWTQLLEELLTTASTTPGYVLYRLDSRSSAGQYEWLLVTFRPDGAPIKQRMQYGPSQEALTRSLGEWSFLEIIHASTPKDCIFPTKLRSDRKHDYQNPQTGTLLEKATFDPSSSNGGVHFDAVRTPAQRPSPILAGKPGLADAVAVQDDGDDEGRSTHESITPLRSVPSVIKSSPVSPGGGVRISSLRRPEGRRSSLHSASDLVPDGLNGLEEPMQRGTALSPAREAGSASRPKSMLSAGSPLDMLTSALSEGPGASPSPSRASPSLTSLQPRDARTDRRGSSLQVPQEEADADSDLDKELGTSSINKTSRRMSMFDFLKSTPPSQSAPLPPEDMGTSQRAPVDRSSILPRVAGSHELTSSASLGANSQDHAPSTSKNDRTPINTRLRPSPIEAARTPRTSRLFARSPVVGHPQNSLAPLSAPAIPSASSSFPAGPATAQPYQSNGSLTAFEFLATQPPPRARSRSRSPGAAEQERHHSHFRRRPSVEGERETGELGHHSSKSVAEEDSSSNLQLRVMPVSESLVMFGSTHTSANYSVSGRLVLTIPLRKSPSRTAEPPEGNVKVANEGAATGFGAIVDSGTSSRSASPSRRLSEDWQHMLPLFDFGSRRGSQANAGEPAQRDGAALASAGSSGTMPALAEGAKSSGAAEEQMKLAVEEVAEPRTTTDARLGDVRAKPTELRVTSLRVYFAGYAHYVDHSGRFSALRLADVQEELLPQGYDLPLSSGHAHASTSAAKYDIEFTLGVPGWLPASITTRFGGNFYCLRAEATYVDLTRNSSFTARSSSTNVLPSEVATFGGLLPSQSAPSGLLLGGSSLRSPYASGDDRSANASGDEYQATRAPATSSNGHAQARDADSASSPRSNGRALPSPLQPTESTQDRAPDQSRSWLGRRGRLLRVRASMSPSSPLRTSTNSSFAGESAQRLPPLVPHSDLHGVSPQGDCTRRQTMPPETSRQQQYNLHSDVVPINIRRCRDVVPVPVARLAVIGPEGLPLGAQQDPPPPTALRNPAANTVITAQPHSVADHPSTTPSVRSTPALEPAASAGPNLPSIDSAPVVQPRRSSAVDAEIQSATAATATSRAPSAPAPPLDAVNGDSQPPRRPDEPVPIGILPVAPDVFSAPSDPAKLAQLTRPPSAPQRASSVPMPEGSTSSQPSGPASVTNTHPMAQGTSVAGSSRQPQAAMRHFLHRPVLHPPADSGITPQECDKDGGLPFSLTLSLPSHVQVDGPKSDMLSFGVQIEVGRTPGWSKVRDLGGLRLRDMELVCLQSERHTSVASRTFCHAFPLPSEPSTAAIDLPILSGRSNQGRLLESRTRSTYDRSLVAYHIQLAEQGKAPKQDHNNVERVRTCVVGPPPSAKELAEAAAEGQGANKANGDAAATQGKGKGKAKQREQGAGNRTVRSRSDRPSDREGEGSTSEGNGSNGAQAAYLPNGAPAPKKTSRGRRAYESAMRGLSSFANAIAEMSVEGETAMFEQLSHQYDDERRRGDGSGRPARERNGQRQREGGEDDSGNGPRATYNFTGDDGHGVDLTRGRVRMTVNLPLVPSSAQIAKRHGLPQLVSDFESPYIRIRHKLRVKLGFGFGHKPLGGVGEGDWGQALVLQVPVRFTDAPPKEVRDQFAPMPLSAVAASATPDSFPPTAPTVSQDQSGPPVLPAYTQLFREDGSRLADEGEDLPQYPGPSNLPLPHRGSVTAPSPRPDTEIADPEPGLSALLSPSASNSSDAATIRAGGGLTDTGAVSATSSPNLARSPASLRRGSNRIMPSHVVDEELLEGQVSGDRLAAMREHQQDLDELRNEVEATDNPLSSSESGTGDEGGDEDEDEDDDNEYEEDDEAAAARGVGTIFRERPQVPLCARERQDQNQHTS